MNRKLLAGICAVGAVCVLAVPSAAFAADAYVDKDTGAAGPCTQVAPCSTIAEGITAAGMNETVRVDDSTTAYAEAVSLANGKSLIAEDFVGGDEGPTIIDGGAVGGGLPGSAVSITSGNSAGTVQGLTLRGDENGVFAAGPVTITENTLDDPQESGFGDVAMPAGVLNVTISDNTFTGGPAGGLDNGITTDNGAAPTITGNSFSGYDFSISLAGPGTTAMVEDNTISGGESEHFLASGIFVQDDSSVTLIHNTVQAPAGGTRGIYVRENEATPAGPTTATLRRNRVSGFPNGVVVDDTTGAVSLDSDLIVNNSVNGLLMRDTANGGLDASQGDVTATNVTLANNGSDLTMVDNDLILDSSIVEDAIGITGTVTCALDFSRGPVMNPGDPTGCGNFQTTAAPGFVNPGAGNYHLDVGSAMIDFGNTADPPMGALDQDGDPRALDGNVDGTPRRDIGADECLGDCRTPTTGGGQPGSIPGLVNPVTNPPPVKTAKKCKKKKKKKKKRSVAAAKKCKKKKKK